MSSTKTKTPQYVKKRTRRGVERWGYDVWLRNERGKRKRFRDWSFGTKSEAQTALAALRTKGWKERYGVNLPEEKFTTTIKQAADSYIKFKKADLLANRSEDPSAYYRETPGHLRTLLRWCEYAGPDRPVTSITKDDFIFWIAEETERGRLKKKPIKKGTIKRGLNTICAALNHAVENTATFKDLVDYHVPKNPLGKNVEEERDRVLTDEEIVLLSEALSAKPEWEEALFFFQLDLMTGARMAELIRMRWTESSSRFGTVKLYSSKTRKWRTISVPAAATLLANRKASGRGGAELVLTHPDHWYRERFRRASKNIGISYGQKTPGGWTPHDLRHTCLTNLAIAGVPINGIKEFAGHASIVETQKYLKFMPQSIELAGKASDRLGQLSRAQLHTEAPHPSKHSLHRIKNTR